QQEIRILVVDVFDAVLFETAILLSDFASVDWLVY
ncbi:MAG: hypothetical protein ACI9UV_002628, partial [Algoriphagus sp.]